MERFDYLPLGSVKPLYGGVQKLSVTASGSNIQHQISKTVSFNYGAVLYPEEFAGNRMAYFNHEAVNYNYDDENSKIYANNLSDYLTATPGVQRGILSA